MRLPDPVVTIFLILGSVTATGKAAEKSVTWTGWFSDLKCASARAVKGTFTATNPECARQCIEAGGAAVFISEQAKAIFQVKAYSAVAGDLGYQLEVQGTVDDAANTITIEKVTRLNYEVPACVRPKKFRK